MSFIGYMTVAKLRLKQKEQKLSLKFKSGKN